MALESPTRSWDKQERELKEEYGRRAANLDLNQAVTKDEGEGDEYDYQPYKEGKTDGGGNQQEKYAYSQIEMEPGKDCASPETETNINSLARMEMNKGPILCGSPTQRCSSPEIHNSSIQCKDQSRSINNDRYDSPQKTSPRESRSLTPDRRSSAARSPLRVSPSPVRKVVSPANDTNASHATAELPSDKPERKIVSPANDTNASHATDELPSDTPERKIVSTANDTNASYATDELPSDINPKLPSDVRHDSSSPSPIRYRSPSPVRQRSVSSAKHTSGSPIRRRSVSPANHMSVSPQRDKAILTRKYKSPSPSHRRDIESSPGMKSSPIRRRRSTDSRDVSPSSKRRKYSPREIRRKSDRSQSPIGRRGVSPIYGRGYRGRSHSRSPVQDYGQRSPRGRYSPRSRYSPRRRYSPRLRTPPRYRPQRRSPRRRPWSPPPNRSTGIGKPGNNLFIAGFSFDTTEKDLERKFSRFGRVTDVRIVRDKRSGDSRGFGFLTLERDEDADAAIRTLDQTEWKGRIVLIEKAKTPTRY